MRYSGRCVLLPNPKYADLRKGHNLPATPRALAHRAERLLFPSSGSATRSPHLSPGAVTEGTGWTSRSSPSELSVNKAHEAVRGKQA